MSDGRYTLDEARQELRRQECEQAGHAPDNRLATLGDLIGRWICACGDVTWSPSGSRFLT